MKLYILTGILMITLGWKAKNNPLESMPKSFTDTPKLRVIDDPAKYAGIILFSPKGIDSITYYYPPFDTTRVIMLCADTATKKNDFSNKVVMANKAVLTLDGNKNKVNWAYWFIGYEVSKDGKHLFYLRDDKQRMENHIFVFQSFPLEQKRKAF